VRRLELFGSAAAAQAADRSLRDLDFLVVFEPSSPREHANRYFGLLEGLGTLFGRPIDLVELSAIRNPYFIESIEASRNPALCRVASSQDDLLMVPGEKLTEA